MRTLVTHANDLPRALVRAPARIKDASHQSDKKAVLDSSLEATGRGELKKVRVEVKCGSVRLRGCVSSYFLKQLAQEAVRPIAIELDLNIDNQLRVSDGGPRVRLEDRTPKHPLSLNTKSSESSKCAR